jgi:hypothetical protein
LALPDEEVVSVSVVVPIGVAAVVRRAEGRLPVIKIKLSNGAVAVEIAGNRL